MFSHAYDFYQILWKVSKATIYIYKYKYIQNSQRGYECKFATSSVSTKPKYLSRDILLQVIFKYVSHLRHWDRIWNERDAIQMGFSDKGRKIREVEAKCYDNCVYSLPADLRRKRKKITEEARINQGEANTDCDSCHLPWVVWKCTKGVKT